MDKVAKEAARAMGGSTKKSLKLNPIHGDDFFSLFNRYAFPCISSDDYKELQHLGTKIAERLGGSPLAAKTIGALLNSNLDERYWRSILNCKNISDHGGNIMPILMLSYHHLPLYLRPCFAFCGSFPKDYEFDKEDVVLKWMALGLIQHSPQNQGQTLEDIGSYYFDELFNKSFFEQKKGFNSKCYYIMHDLLHDVARSVSHGECFSIVDDDKSVEDIPNTVRHLYLATDNPNIVMKADKWQQLRSIQLTIRNSVLPEVLEKVIKSLKCVRILEVCVYGMRVLPDVFGHLRHLRSVTISREIDEFPVSLCKLHNLQVLEFPIRDSTAALPENIKKLISLRHLVTPSFYYGVRICPVIARVRRLASLQVLRICIKKERDYKIVELESLNMIRELHLDGLENVESRGEASMAKLGNKEHLRVLSLRWSGDNDDTERNINPTSKMGEQQQILDCLQPHSSLKELTIEGYKGVMPAKWMDFELVNNLQRISLCYCSRLEQLPSFAKLPFLKYLSLREMPLVKQLDCDCQQLEELYLRFMQGLEELSESDGNSGQWCPCLRKLEIEDTPKLSVLPSLSLILQSMYLLNVGLTALPKLWLDSTKRSSSSLKSLKILGCSEVTSPDKGLLLHQHYLTDLVTLEISSCDMLVDFPAGGLQHLCALTILAISKCPNLRLDPTVKDPAGNDENFLPSSLRNLCIEDCGELERSIPTLLKGAPTSLSSLSLGGIKSLPCSSVWRRLASLEYLALTGAGELQSVPRLPSSVRHLIIYGCNETLKDRCRKDEGADWPNINHIPDITIE